MQDSNITLYSKKAEKFTFFAVISVPERLQMTAPVYIQPLAQGHFDSTHVSVDVHTVCLGD